ncbi:saccharopine dehydrogenase family protein [Prauserella cavernicola]|uniref:Saccharopine dehydrogenase NADP-binding domain-containing protein n=1 Tax=Prauserella cavernicola TaxID=2800127 RepID=A0A934V5G6_9PSEU|nr:saccharopine dehydrogenase NADP-binding domain-containing protein [Prauserella cavernicola]MBK1786477.1 saccharopine dehydrogenase NADP-binding domain-containing protein [Prauserella cavernicola]
MAATREHDIVLFGATGFTGGLTAEYLARHAPAECRWALAGRDRAKLQRTRERLAAINPACADLPLLTADVTDSTSLRAVAESARVVITTVGPYLQYGEPLVAACAQSGTDYVDLAGEPEFADRTYLDQHATAQRTGARIVHACGFDSIPYDLGVYFTVGKLPKDVPLTVTGQIKVSAQFSGGTYSSVLAAFSRARQMARTAKARRRAEPWPKDRAIHTPFGRPSKDPGTGRWLVPLPTIDPQIVARSAAALPRYGPDFTYRHTAVVKRLPTIVVAGAGLGVLAVLAQIPPARNLLGRLRKPGEGPGERQRAKSWFNVRFTGEGGGTKVVTEFAGGDPGYDESAKMLSESALCLAFDDLPATSGQVTTAVAMGDALLERLQAAGLTIRELD